LKEKIFDYFSGDYFFFYQKYLSKVEKAGAEEFKALCPFHDDSKPSLNFKKSTGQFYCHPCEIGGDIFSFYGRLKNLNVKSDFPKICRGIADDFGIAFDLKPKAKIIKTYDYTDQAGRLMFQVCRMQPKSFRQRRPDGNGGWAWNLKGVNTTLYQLPAVIQAEQVLVVEGEKDCDNLRELGFTATTCPMGAGKWRDHYNQHLKGKQVVLVPDNDEPGREHMISVARSLNGQATDIKLLELPEVPHKGDVSDFIAIFDDRKEAADLLKNLIKRTPAYVPQEPGEQIESNTKSEKDLSFPYQVLTGAAGVFADVYSDYIEAPVQFLFMGYLTALGAVLSRSLRVNSVLDTQPRLYTLLVGESAADRKSTTLNIISKHFKSNIDGFSSCWGIGSAEGLRNVIEKSGGDDFCIMEKGESPGTLLIFDEFKSFVNKCRIDSSVLLPCVNSLFESNHYESHTKTKSVKIEDAYLSMLAASTLQTYERIYNEAFRDIGFPNRVFLVIGTAERRFSFPSKIPESENELMSENLLKVLRHIGSGIELDINQDAKEIYHDWYLNLDKSIHARRLDTYSLRLMQLLAINNLKSEIDAETVEQAIALCDWQLEIRRIYDPIDADTKIAKMEELIRRALTQGNKKDRELKQRVNAYRAGLWFYETALKNLRKSKEVFWNKKQKSWYLKD
jgi:5S rRNA maturation endonuclease (ribonuclease M5)